MRRSARRRSGAYTALAVGLLSAFAGGAFGAGAGAAPDAEIGRQIYLEGRAGNEPVLASRAAGVATRGAAAACVNCHRRSGMGGSEGRTYVPPIDARALFTAQPAGGYASPTGLGREPFTEASLARALTHGVAPDGRTLNYLMPRYELDAVQLNSLVAYLRTLSDTPPAGIRDGTVHLATLIVGDVPPSTRSSVEKTMQACVAEHNAGPGDERRRKLLSAQMGRAPAQPWALHVWSLSGPASGWDAQLREHARRQPVFALLGGVVGASADWSAVHAYCEREGIACIYPHLAAPPTSKNSHFSIFASAGVNLEAGLIARQLRESAPRRVVQWLRSGDAAAQQGADALRDLLAGSGIDVVQRHIGEEAAIDATAQVLWLRGDDLQRFAPPAQDGTLFISASLFEHQLDAVPENLRRTAIVAHPHELPQRRVARADALRSWLAKNGLPFEDEALQADALMACSALHNGMAEVVERPGTEYLLERLETIAERRGFAGLYPRLSLGTGQRFASKTGYLVRFAGPALDRVEPLGDPVAP